jgi:hypothetical protein
MSALGECTDLHKSESTFGADASRLFRPEAIADACDKCGIEGAMREAVLRALDEIDASPQELRAAWHYYHLLFLSGGDQIAAARHWPGAPPGASIGRRLLFAVVCLAGLPEVRRQHAARGIPEEITWHTFGDLRVWLNHDAGGDWVFEKIDWLARHCQLRLFRLGRIQIELTRFTLPVRLLEHIEKRWVVAEEGGRVVDPWGCVLPESYDFDPQSWNVLVKAGDDVAIAHLPEDGVLRYGDGFGLALTVPAFLSQHFPERHVKALYFEGWLADPALELALPPRAALVRLNREMYHLKREHGSERPMLRSLFGRPVKSIDEVVPETNMQKTLVNAIRAGVTFRGGSALFALDWPAGEHARRAFRNWQQAHGR